MPERHDIPDLKDIIDNADTEVLRTFLKKQATRNTALALKLRAHLVAGIDSLKGVNKYGQVLGLLVHHDVQGTIHLTKRSLQILRDICEDFIKLLYQHLQEGELREAWEAAYAVIFHLHLLMDKYQGPDQKLIAILSESYVHVLGLLQLNPAPELRQSIYASLYEIVSRNHHVIYDIGNNAITCIIQSASDIHERKHISELMAEKVLKADEVVDTQRKLWSALLLKIPDTRFDLKSRISKKYVYDIAHLLHAANDSVSLSRLLKLFAPPEDLTLSQQKQWLKWKFDLALQSGNQADIQESGWEFLRLDEDINIYRKMRSATSTSKLSADLLSPDISDDLRSEIYAEEHQWDDFLSLLRKSGSLPMLIRHCKDVVHHAEDPETLIHEVSFAYAVHNGGPKSTEQISLLMETLHSLRYTKLAGNLAEQLRLDFPGRFDDVWKAKSRKKGRKLFIDSDDPLGFEL